MDAYQTAAVEAEDNWPFACVRLLGYENVGSDGMVSDMLEVCLEDVEAVELGV
jgi:hypothetical protein